MSSPQRVGKVVASVVAGLAAAVALSVPADGQLATARNPRMRVGSGNLNSPAAVEPGPPTQEASPFDTIVVFGTNSVFLSQSSDVLSGDVIANDDSPGPTLGNDELTVGRSVTTPAGASIKGHSIKVKLNAVVDSDVFHNELDNNGTINGTVNTPLSLPVIAPEDIPPFVEERGGNDDIEVPIGGTQTLPAGDYGLVKVKKNGTINLTGGIYNIREIDGGQPSHWVFFAPTEIRVEEKFAIDKNSTFRPDAASGLSASDIVVYVAGINGNNGNLGATPKAARLGISSEVEANFYVPNGTLHLRQNTEAIGAFLAKDVDVGIGVQVSLDSAFGNKAPSADPQIFSGSGTITLTGSDPEGETLTFSIVTQPTVGTLGSITPIVPTPITMPDDEHPGADCNVTPQFCVTTQPPTVSATVVYTEDPQNPGAADSFNFKVTDPAGASGTAVVTINPPPDNSPPPPDVTEVDALDKSADTSKDTPVGIGLDASGPPGETLTFTAQTLPASGALTDSNGDPVTTGDPLPGPALVFDPEGVIGSPSFDYSAGDSTTPSCGAPSTPNCDVATVNIDVSETLELANDQQVSTFLNEAVGVALSGNRTITGEGSGAGLTAVAGGEVLDNTNDGLGDSSSTPNLSAASLDSNAGPDDVRFHAEWDLVGLDLVEVRSAFVVLQTSLQTGDTLDTLFFTGTGDGNGTLEASDFETAANNLPGVVMPADSSLSFAFDVTPQVQQAVADGFTHFTVQGRLDPDDGDGSGLHVNTLLFQGQLPGVQLSIGTLGPVPLLYEIVSLPANGALTDSAGNPVVLNQKFASIGSVGLVYTPDFCVASDPVPDSFDFEVTEDTTTDTGTIDITVVNQENAALVGRAEVCGQ